jgi:exonuclease V
MNLYGISNLKKLIPIYMNSFQILHNESSQTMQIRFISQKTTQILKTFNVSYDPEWSQFETLNALYLWLGLRNPVGVQEIEEAYKCQTCEFASSCDWRQSKADELCKENMSLC